MHFISFSTARRVFERRGNVTTQRSIFLVLDFHHTVRRGSAMGGGVLERRACAWSWKWRRRAAANVVRMRAVR